MSEQPTRKRVYKDYLENNRFTFPYLNPPPSFSNNNKMPGEKSITMAVDNNQIVL